MQNMERQALDAEMLSRLMPDKPTVKYALWTVATRKQAKSNSAGSVIEIGDDKEEALEYWRRAARCNYYAELFTQDATGALHKTGYRHQVDEKQRALEVEIAEMERAIANGEGNADYIEIEIEGLRMDYEALELRAI